MNPHTHKIPTPLKLWRKEELPFTVLLGMPYPHRSKSKEKKIKECKYHLFFSSFFLNGECVYVYTVWIRCTIKDGHSRSLFFSFSPAIIEKKTGSVPFVFVYTNPKTTRRRRSKKVGGLVYTHTLIYATKRGNPEGGHRVGVVWTTTNHHLYSRTLAQKRTRLPRFTSLSNIFFELKRTPVAAFYLIRY